MNVSQYDAVVSTHQALINFLEFPTTHKLMRLTINGEPALRNYFAHELTNADKIQIFFGVGDKSEANIKGFFTEESCHKTLRSVVKLEMEITPFETIKGRKIYAQASLVDRVMRILFKDPKDTNRLTYSRTRFVTGMFH